MAGTRTAPTVSGTPNYKRVSMSFVDAQGDIRSASLIVDAATTAGTIETLVATTQAASNASIYEVSVVDVYEGARQTANASDTVVNSVHSNIVYHVKVSPTASQRGYIPAPIDAVFIAGTDTPDINNATLTAWFTAVLAAAGAGYTGQSIRFTERREQNDSVKF